MPCRRLVCLTERLRHMRARNNLQSRLELAWMMCGMAILYLTVALMRTLRFAGAIPHRAASAWPAETGK